MRPRLLLIPEVSEIQWRIRPLLEEWADVRSFDPPGIGGEPGSPSAESMVARAAGEVERVGWDRFVILADAHAVSSAVAFAGVRRDSVAAMALGHAALSNRRDGDAPPVSAAVYDALSQVIKTDSRTFLQHAVFQATSGSADEQLAEEIVARVPQDRLLDYWQVMTEPVEYGDTLEALDLPLLLASHEGCVMHTAEGYTAAVERFPHAKTVRCARAPCVDPDFAAAVRDLCAEVW